MLVLSRKRLEELLIGSDIRLRVISVGTGRVALGIEAPADVRVCRMGPDPITIPTATDAPLSSK